MSSPREILSRHAAAAGMPVHDYLIKSLIERFEARSTLLVICPNSVAVVRAAVRAARDAGAPLLFTATLNQVDYDGGYTGWTQSELVAFVEEEADRAGFDGPLLVCLDHGGPWLKDAHAEQGMSFDETMDALMESIAASMDAGYALLHIDPTIDRMLPGGEPPPIDLIIRRTVELIQFAEQFRTSRGLEPVSYEVGTEEVGGGLANVEAFAEFLNGLEAGLADRGLSHAWPCMVVGKVGTDLHTTHFDPEFARQLTELVRPRGSLLKGHYTDLVDNPRDYVLSGMGAANVGPEFTAAEFDALLELDELASRIGRGRCLEAAATETLVVSGRWRKWLTGDERECRFDELSPERRQWLVRTGSRYVWTHPVVRDARQALYDRVGEVCNPDAFVIWRIQTAITKYYHAFNQVDFTKALLNGLQEGATTRRRSV